MSIKLTIDGTEIEAQSGQTILEAALAAGVYIPHLCHHPNLPSFQEVSPANACFRGKEKFQSNSGKGTYEGCGLCLVSVEDQEEPVLSCVTKAEAGMEITTSSPELESKRRDNLVPILSAHPHACLTCAQKEGCSLTQCSTNVPEDERCCPLFDGCELRRVAEYVGIKEDTPCYVPQKLYCEEDKPLFIRDYNLCVGCLRCVRVCRDVVGAKALGYVLSGGEIAVGSSSSTLEESGCRFCGACVEVCPTGALRDKALRAGERKEALIPCIANCPVGMEIPAYVNAILRGEYSEARDIIRERVPFGLSLGYICHHPCEEECRRGELNQAVAICGLKRFALEASESPSDVEKAKDSGKKVAVIGAGPAGLTAAYFLAKSGHSVTVYESQSAPGGMLRWAVPEYRLPRDIIQKEVEAVKALGVEILTDTPINSQNFVEKLKLEDWDAVFLATGAQESKRIDVEGLPKEGILWGLDFLRDAKQKMQKGLQGKLVVIGGGNVAMDVAMTAFRLGASGVELVCLECREEMPAFSWEVEEAEKEGVVIHPGWGPVKVRTEGDKIKEVEFQACTSVFDEQGDFCPAFDASQRKSLQADAVILAVGQSVDLTYLPSEFGIQQTEQGMIQVNKDSLGTNIPKVFSGGEVTSGPASAVEAMAMGRKAADSIDRYLGGNGLDGSTSSKEKGKNNLWRGEDKDFSSKERVSMVELPPEERLRSFGLIQLGYTEEEAKQEASRCLSCDLRFQLSPVTLPPERWLELAPEVLSQVPETEGAFQLLDEEKNIIYIAGTQNLRQTLEEQLTSKPEAKYFGYEEDQMYTKRESELIQQFLQQHGRLPAGNEDVDDLF
jgi:NADPH-dependent glutamate synthase beta subunit-like oxidoreductase/NAD-dependent dihydropyrimidine dehydrogenase PreA subunit